MSHFILDSCWESIVELMAECSISPMDTCDKAVELNQVFGNLLFIMHTEGFQVGFAFAYGVVWSKVVFQFSHKFRVVIDLGRVNVQREHGFKPVQGGSFQVRWYIGNFHAIE